MILNYLFRFLRRINNYVPSRFEVRYKLRNNESKLTCSLHELMLEYAYLGKDFQYLMRKTGYTEERIRQLLIKGCR